jgi:hypothetical protein
MKKTYLKNLKHLFFTGVLLSATIYGCKKDAARTVDVDTKAAQDNAQGQYVFSNVNHIVDDAARSQGGVNKTQGIECATIDTSNAGVNQPFPKTLIITFDSTCKNINGDMRKGSIKIVFSDHVKNKGATITTTFQKYVFNGYKVEGTLTETNNGISTGFTLPSYTFSLPDGKITSSSGSVLTLTLNQTKQLLVGAGRTTVEGDSYQISGSSSGTSAGTGFTATVEKPLVYDASLPCQYITKGVLNVKPTEKEMRVVDFGDGTCTGKATVQIGANTFTISQSVK